MMSIIIRIKVVFQISAATRVVQSNIKKFMNYNITYIIIYVIYKFK